MKRAIYVKVMACPDCNFSEADNVAKAIGIPHEFILLEDVNGKKIWLCPTCGTEFKE
jgi:PP-loop superfamily ATP-utilizing enzyme